MKNVLVIDGAVNCVFDIFQATPLEFETIFPGDTDIAFIDEVLTRHTEVEISTVFSQIWQRRIAKRDAIGIHGTLFYELQAKKDYYPTRKDEEAINLDGTRLR